jgi:hypothetical protein
MLGSEKRCPILAVAARSPRACGISSRFPVPAAAGDPESNTVAAETVRPSAPLAARRGKGKNMPLG